MWTRPVLVQVRRQLVTSSSHCRKVLLVGCCHCCSNLRYQCQLRRLHSCTLQEAAD